MKEEINDFIKKSLDSGKSADEIKKSLIEVGWKEKDVQKALSQTVPANKTFSEDIPLPPKTNQEKHDIVSIFINFASFILLGIVATTVGILYFQIINSYIADALSATKSYYASRQMVSTVNYATASLIVASPLYFLGLRYWIKSFKKDKNKSESKLTKWITYLVLLIAGGTIAGDLIGLIFGFLQGELSSRFILKALVILFISGLIFGFYFLERKMVQFKKDIPSSLFKIIFGVALGMIIVGIVLGLMTTGGPSNERDRRLDDQRARDLYEISTGVSRFANDNYRLPESLEELINNEIYSRYVSVRVDPETQNEYQYNVLDIAKYELCAVFTLSTIDELNKVRDYYGGGNAWYQHDAGKVCKEQVVTWGRVNDPFRKPTIVR